MSSLKRWNQVGGGEFQKWTDKGQEIEGIWRGSHDGKFGALGSVDTADGRVVFPLHTALLDRMQHVREGQEVRIVYNGEQVSKGGRTFKAFTVFVAEPMELPGVAVESAHAGNARKPSVVNAPSDDVPF